MSRRRSQGVWAATILGYLALPAALGAQDSPIVAPVDSGVCFDRIPTSAMKPVAVHTIVRVVIPDDSSAALVLPPALAMNRATTWHVRDLLGGSEGATPSADPVVTWRRADGTLRVTAHRAGSLFFADLDEEATAPGSGVALLGSGLTAAASAGVKLEWPAGVTSDSLVFDLELVHENQDRRRVTTGPRLEPPEPVFTVMMPRKHPARMIRGRISYPSDLYGKGLGGFITLTFVVDTAGRVESKTVRDIWPSDRPRLVGEMGRYYDAFVAAVRRGLPNARFEPARVGGCPVKIWVQQSFDFRPPR